MTFATPPNRRPSHTLKDRTKVPQGSWWTKAKTREEFDAAAARRRTDMGRGIHPPKFEWKTK